MSTPIALLLTILGAAAVTVLAGLIYQSRMASRDRKNFPPPGVRVDIGGGTALHLLAMGEGEPLVVLDAALGGTSLSWTRIQPEIAARTGVLAYDRAGFGWSDPSPFPRTAELMADELSRLLSRCTDTRPFVLVGHSYGALVAQLYASLNPDQVAGLVLVDPALPEEWSEPSPHNAKRVRRGVRLARRSATLARVGAIRAFLRLSALPGNPLARVLAFVLTSGSGNERPRVLGLLDRVPEDVRPALRAIWSQPGPFEALASQIQHVPESAASVQARCKDFGNLPLIVLSAAEPDAQRLEAYERLAERSTKGRVVIAQASGHWIPLEDPALIVEAVGSVLESLRSESKPNYRSSPGG